MTLPAPPPDLAPPTAESADRKRGPAARALLTAVGCYALVRLTGLLALAAWSAHSGKSATTLLARRWDSLWYVRVVDQGYGFVLTAPDGRRLSDMAFFPLLPWLEEGVSRATGLPEPDAGLLVSAVASLAAAAGIFAVVRLWRPDAVAVAAVVLWAALPVGIVQSMAYSESLFVALAAWALYCALTGRWLAAGVLACGAGLTRPVGAAVAAAVWVAAAGAARRGGASARLVAGAVLAPVGAAAYVLWAGHRRGDLLGGYLGVQKDWGNGFDGGAAFARFLGGLLRGPAFAAALALAAGIGLLLWGYGRGFTRGYPLPAQVYSGVVVVLALGSSGYFGSKPRLLMPAFTLLVPVAEWSARLPRRVRLAAAALLVLGSAAYGAFWLNGSGPP